MQENFFYWGIVRGREVHYIWEKGRSNNAGKKQPNFDDSSNFAKQSQPTEKEEEIRTGALLIKGAPVKSGLTFQNNISMD